MAIQTTRECWSKWHRTATGKNITNGIHHGTGRDRGDVYKEDPAFDHKPTYQGRCICGWVSRRVYVKRIAQMYLDTHLGGTDNSFEGKMMRVLGL
ncbi:hypothetical protein PP304_gp021 [Gordonia phage Phendrix]|uniref:Uncharacterized protein n=1 Tax=Gordonia phage Phendrix TaxID=2593335 RepID=A0A514U0V1_9CAUD|nr:hypothetical protein PP304_gp021 [Gordonia phage Phendrix]QDK02569.1 hypothetical protein SEA_PHENDRIX_21 [Gordonia phage Phendrix]